MSEKTKPKTGKGSKTDTYTRWKMDGVLNDKLLLIEGYARDGATEYQIAEAIGIHKNTLVRMKLEHSEISEALRKGKEIVDYAVENALLRKALSGDVTAMIFWLKNRKPHQWRDLKELNSNMKDGFVNLDFTGIIAQINTGNNSDLLDTGNNNINQNPLEVEVEVSSNDE